MSDGAKVHGLHLIQLLQSLLQMMKLHLMVESEASEKIREAL